VVAEEALGLGGRVEERHYEYWVILLIRYRNDELDVVSVLSSYSFLFVLSIR
jgi:hypothetical protein